VVVSSIESFRLKTNILYLFIIDILELYFYFEFESNDKPLNSKNDFEQHSKFIIVDEYDIVKISYV